jgi:hypothetical protein
MVSISLLLFNSCDKEQESEKMEISGKLINNSDCKSFNGFYRNPDTPDSLSCIEYTFDTLSNKLNLRHINSGFNCCPEKLFCKVSIIGDTIIVEESEKESLCDCNCLYDLDIELEGVEEKLYFLKIIEPYSSNQEKLYFYLDLFESKVGEYCVKREKYPWGN